MNVIQFPDGKRVKVQPAQLEMLLTIPPDTPLSLEDIAQIINKRRELYQEFVASSSSEKNHFHAGKITRQYVRLAISELNLRVEEQIIQRSSVQSHYRLAPQYSEQ